jgi:hypothetical protein
LEGVAKGVAGHRFRTGNPCGDSQCYAEAGPAEPRKLRRVAALRRLALLAKMRNTTPSLLAL